ncbi:hypothetical protein K502DRAFT_245055 [Neoconidiobolus thromboides FSU 785]|nr:hypothetical protein K502DRAFT_245055 [Neoconidiobolus thromboides FSU 785]
MKSKDISFGRFIYCVRPYNIQLTHIYFFSFILILNYWCCYCIRFIFNVFDQISFNSLFQTIFGWGIDMIQNNWH